MTDEIMQTYSFSYTDCEGKKYEKTITTSGMTWLECMNDYVRFLESVFQYGIMDNVRLKEPIWRKAMIEHHSDYLDPWTGEYFSDEQEETDEDLPTSKFWQE